MKAYFPLQRGIVFAISVMCVGMRVYNLVLVTFSGLITLVLDDGPDESNEYDS